MPDPDLHLDLRYWPATETERLRYVFTLTHHGGEPLVGFALAWSGHGRIDPAVPIEGAILMRRESNYVEVAPPSGFVLHPGEAWVFTVRATSKPMRHWTDAASAAFVLRAAGTPLPVAVGLCAYADAPPVAPRLGRDPPSPAVPVADGLAVVPRPRHVAVRGMLSALALTPAGEGAAATSAIVAFKTLTDLLFPDENLVAPSGMPVRLTKSEIADESYRLSFADGGARLEAAGGPGFLYGLVTLGQLLVAVHRDRNDRFRIPADGVIEDGPEFSWRGVHLDVARQFYDIAELRRLLAIMAWNKLNRFHLHLTEDEAWRWEVSAYPELVARGAMRGHGLALPPLLGSGAEPYGGSYSKAELRALVAFAATLNIEIMPEIDVPGHCLAAVSALPWLRDPGENGHYRSVQGFTNNCLNPAVPRAIEFIETLFRELLDLFPGRHIHVGADEVPVDAWASSLLAAARLAELGGGGALTLQADFLRRLHTLLREAGRVTGAWEEGAHGGGIAPTESLMFAWRNTSIGGALAAAGYDVVMAPGQAYYLDMALGPDWAEPGAAWAGHSSVENTYRFDPVTGFAPEHRARLRGVQCCIWSEPMRDRRVFERLVFPRLSAVAETGWTPREKKSFRDFEQSVPFLPTLAPRDP